MPGPGRLSKKDMAFIRENHDILSPAEMAKALNRNTETITKILRKVKRQEITKVSEQTDDIAEALKKTPTWKRLRDEFTKSELDYFTHEYTKLLSQFDNDIRASEESQIINLVRLQILMSRNMADMKKARADIDRMEMMQREISQSMNEDSEGERGELLQIETQIQAARAALISKSSEYTKLSDQHSSLMKLLKGTRDQRIKEIQTSKKDYATLLKQMLEEEYRSVVSRESELTRVAGEAAAKELGKLTEYEDGQWDRPLLNADTAKYKE